MKKIKIALLLGAVFLGYSAFASDPAISDVTVRQRWPWSKLVDIDYVLACDDPEVADIAVNGFNGVVPLVLPPSSLSGDRYDVSSGSRRIVWDPTATSYTNAGVLSKFRVELTSTRVPLYMIVDLTKDAGAPDQITYVYEADLRAGTWGSWVENPVSTNGAEIQSVVWTGVTTNEIYKTDKLVLRRVPAGSVGMRAVITDSPIPTTLTKACYVGVFQVTQKQWFKMMGSSPSSFSGDSKPVEQVSYQHIRGSSAGANWPGSSSVDTNSFVGKLRTKTGMAGFDLPTEAQWEYACRAGTTTYFNDGINGSDANQMLVLGWANNNSPTSTQLVGQKTPNAWGLYDMHGNVWEWCLDWSAATLSGGTDPLGPKTGSNRVRRGGSWAGPTSSCGSAFRYSGAPNLVHGSIGFRIVRTMP